LPGRLLRLLGRAGDLRQRLLGHVVRLTWEAAGILTHSTPVDDRAARALLGRDPIPIARSLRDLLVWMRAAGVLQARHVGAGGGAAPAPRGPREGGRPRPGGGPGAPRGPPGGGPGAGPPGRRWSAGGRRPPRSSSRASATRAPRSSRGARAAPGAGRSRRC